MGDSYDINSNNFAAVRTMTDAFETTISYNTFTHATYGMALTSDSSVKFPGNSYNDLYQTLTLYTPPDLPINPSDPSLATAAAATAAADGTGTTSTDPTGDHGPNRGCVIPRIRRRVRERIPAHIFLNAST